MPVVDGLKATREISKALPSIPSLIYTVHDVAWIQIEARKAGARKVISKPNADLLRVAEELLRKDCPPPCPPLEIFLLLRLSRLSLTLHPKLDVAPKRRCFSGCTTDGPSHSRAQILR
jgi:hypothetical protein